MFRTYGAIVDLGHCYTTATDTYGALAVAWILPAANAARLKSTVDFAKSFIIASDWDDVAKPVTITPVGTLFKASSWTNG